MKEKYCPRCNGLKSASEKFCSQCGVELKELPLCPHCGARNFPISRFCCMCGKPKEERVEIEKPKEEVLVSSPVSEGKQIKEEVKNETPREIS